MLVIIYIVPRYYNNLNFMPMLFQIVSLHIKPNNQNFKFRSNNHFDLKIRKDYYSTRVSRCTVLA